ncbi:MAG: hypothetical protein JWN84_1560 [Nocardioides sp.]|nr:hypothetical protein [Nocardioides sp.]
MISHPLPRLLAVVATVLTMALTAHPSAAAAVDPTEAPVSATTSAASGSAARTVGLVRAAAVSYRTVRQREKIPLSVRTVRTADLPRGVRRVARWGHPGLKVIVWRVKYEGAKPVAARKLRTNVVRRPQSRIVRVGTRVSSGPRCHGSYRGACVPIASDVDCAGGSGNGPAYVDGPVYVVGDDVYGLDSDGDGVACE